MSFGNVRKHKKFGYYPQELLAPDFVDFHWHLKFRQKMGDELLELVVMVVWCLWFNWNEVS